MKHVVLLACLALAACGADGAPTKPDLRVSGDVQMGIQTR
jgi:predicted small lipoprotein YifL